MAEYDFETAVVEARKEAELQPTRVSYREPLIRFFIKNTSVQERHVSDLSRLFDVYTYNFWGEEEQEFTVLDFTDSLWLVPNLTPLVWARREWRDHLLANRGYFYAHLGAGGFPKQWPLKTFLGYRYGYLPKPAVVPGRNFPSEAWKLEGPLDPRNDAPLPLDNES